MKRDFTTINITQDMRRVMWHITYKLFKKKIDKDREKWLRQLARNSRIIHYRLNAGWDVHDALTTPFPDYLDNKDLDI